ncbi:type IV secretory system conjugative DNA transfer family protein [Burkholderia vietnamiensis]|nr:type IV secretory system conjugative DNA transfer family protein [Burkholderia vietnamiensis]
MKTTKLKQSVKKGLNWLLPNLSIKNMHKRTDMKFLAKKAQETVDYVSGRNDVPKGDWVPRDLRDTVGNFQQTASGFPVTTVVLPKEVSVGSTSPVSTVLDVLTVPAVMSLILGIKFASLPLILPIFPLLFLKHKMDGVSRLLGGTKAAISLVALALTGIPAYMLYKQNAFSFLSSSGSGLPFSATTLAAALTLPLVFYPKYRNYQKNKRRQHELMRNSNRYGGAAFKSSQVNKDRELQALNGLQQEEAGAIFIEFGTATGYNSSIGDPFAPDRGLPFGVSDEDLKLHAMFFGSTGMSKTSSLMRPIVTEIGKTKAGLILLDGKGALPYEINSDKIKLIAPERVKHFNYVAGLEPTILAYTLLTTFSPPTAGDHNAIFKEYSYIHAVYAFIFRQSLIKHGIMNDSPITIKEIADLYMTPAKFDKDNKMQIVEHPLIQLFFQNEKAARDLDGGDPTLNDAFNSYRNFLQSGDEEREKISMSFTTWIVPFFQNKELYDWNNSTSAQSEIHLPDLHNGAQFSLALPEKKFGLTGRAIYKFFQAQVLNNLYNRGEGWKARGEQHVFIIADECQDIFDNTTADAMAWLRGFGGSFIGATQNWESLVKAMGEIAAKKLFDGFHTFGTFKSSKATYEVIANKMEKLKLYQEGGSAPILSYAATSTSNLANAIFDVTNPDRKLMRRVGGTDMDALFGYDNSAINAVADIFGAKRNDKLAQEDKIYQNSGLQFLKYSEQPISPFNEQTQAKLTGAFTGFFQVMRGGFPRRDVVECNPMTSDMKEIKTLTANAHKKLLAKHGVNVSHEQQMEEILGSFADDIKTEKLLKNKLPPELQEMEDRADKLIKEIEKEKEIEIGV